MTHRIEPDACATQLDLAQAYIDMGDPDGCRDLLEQVLAADTAQQQACARELEAQLRAVWQSYRDPPLEIKASHSSAAAPTKPATVIIDEPAGQVDLFGAVP